MEFVEQLKGVINLAKLETQLNMLAAEEYPKFSSPRARVKYLGFVIDRFRRYENQKNSLGVFGKSFYYISLLKISTAFRQ